METVETFSPVVEVEAAAAVDAAVEACSPVEAVELFSPVVEAAAVLCSPEVAVEATVDA